MARFYAYALFFLFSTISATDSFTEWLKQAPVVPALSRLQQSISDNVHTLGAELEKHARAVYAYAQHGFERLQDAIVHDPDVVEALAWLQEWAKHNACVQWSKKHPYTTMFGVSTVAALIAYYWGKATERKRFKKEQALNPWYQLVLQK